MSRATIMPTFHACTQTTRQCKCRLEMVYWRLRHFHDISLERVGASLNYRRKTFSGSVMQTKLLYPLFNRLTLTLLLPLHTRPIYNERDISTTAKKQACFSLSIY